MSSRRTPRGGCENGCRNQWRAQTHQRWHAARGARRVRARPARRRCRTQSENRAPARLERRDGFCGRRHRSRAFCGRRMTTAVETIRDEPLTIGGRTFQSRLMVGTGKYPDMDTMVRAIEASGAEVVTVAVRRVNLDRSKESSVLHFLDPKRIFLLANTAGCYTAADASRYARLAREAGFNDFVKLEVIGDEETLLPDVAGLLEAAKVLVQEGFKLLPYTNEDLVTALRLEDAGCAAVMPLASPIGSGLGLLNPFSVRTIKRRLHVPVIVDAGVGTASDACVTMEQGVDGILMNTAIAAAQDPVAMAQAMRLATIAGRAAYLAGRMPRREVAMPSSPTRGCRIREATAARPAAPEGLRGVAARAPLTDARDRHLEGLAERDRRLAYELSAGVLRRQRDLDSALELDRADPRLHDVLRLGAYQLRWLTRVPSHAAVSTSVELARETVGEGATGYVNHALRKLSGARSTEHGAEKTHPDWLVARWTARFGAHETRALLAWNDRRPTLTLQPAQR